jgi:hypothetical protein
MMTHHHDDPEIESDDAEFAASGVVAQPDKARVVERSAMRSVVAMSRD